MTAAQTENGGIRSTFVSAIASAKHRVDNWQNVLTGLGGVRDKLTSMLFQPTMRLDDETLESMYHGDDMAARIVDALPHDMMRMGYDLTVSASEDDGEDAEKQTEVSSDMLARLDALDTTTKFLRALIWGRLYGGSVILLGADDGALDMTEPLNEERIRSFEWMSVMDKRDVIPMTWYSDPRNPKFGLPKTYTIQPTGVTPGDMVATGAQEVHESRLIIFTGALTSNRRKRENEGWDFSVLQRVEEALRTFHSNYQSVSHLMTDASQGVFKVKGLVDMISGGEKSTLQTRMELLDMSRSVARSIMLDADDESFERVATTFVGLPELVDKSMIRLAAAARMPVTILMGQSPAGMNATGDSDIRWWYDTVRVEQETELRPKLERLVHLLFVSQDGPTNGQEPDNWTIEFPSLWQPTPKEEAELRKLIADTDAIYITQQVTLPEEIALSRFRAEGYSTETIIDLDTRQEMMSDDERVAADPDDVDPDAPVDPDAEPVEADIVVPEAADPGSAFNGAQVQALQGIVNDVIAGATPPETAAAMLAIAFPLSLEDATSLIETIPEGFEGSGPEPEPTPGGGPEGAPPAPPPPPGAEPPPEPPEPEGEAKETEDALIHVHTVTIDGKQQRTSGGEGQGHTHSISLVVGGRAFVLVSSASGPGPSHTHTFTHKDTTHTTSTEL